MTEQARVTQAGALVEYEGVPTIFVTQAGAFVEYEGTPAIFVTQMGALVEYEPIAAEVGGVSQLLAPLRMRAGGIHSRLI